MILPRHLRRTPHRRASRRGFVIIAVLVTMSMALLIVMSVLLMTQAEVASQTNEASATESRALAWSGAQLIMQELDRQRDAILEGARPELDESYTLYERGGGMGVVRLLPIGPDGAHLVPEAGKLDLNHVDAAALAATEMVSASIAEAIIAWRERLGRPIQSVAELLQVPGVTRELLYGPIDDMRVMDDAQGAEMDLGERVAVRLSGVEARGLADVVTVYAVEPELQRSGVKRINLNVPWSDELGTRLDDRFGEGTGDLVKQIIEGGTTFDDRSVMFQVMRFFDMDPADWDEPADALTTIDGDYAFGRVDINSAPYEALLALPGITPEAADQIVEVREGLSRDDRDHIAWPIIEGILPAETYDELGGMITTRSWTHRLRIAAGEVSADEPERRMQRPVIFEMVVDLAGPEARLAYLRDITLMQAAVVLMNEELGDDDLADEMTADLAGPTEALAEGDPLAEGPATMDDLMREPADGGREPLDDPLDIGELDIGGLDLDDDLAAMDNGWDDSADAMLNQPTEGTEHEGPPSRGGGSASGESENRSRIGRWRSG